MSPDYQDFDYLSDPESHSYTYCKNPPNKTLLALKIAALLRTYASLAIAVYFRNRLYTRRLFVEIENQKVLPHPLSPALRRRIQFYTAQCYISALWTCSLRGQALTPTEKKYVIYLGALTPLVDDLTDGSKLTATAILDRLKGTTSGSENEEIVLARYLYTKLVQSQIEAFHPVFEQALRAQDASLRQLEAVPLDRATLAQIALDKGGAFSLLYRIILTPPLQTGEVEALMTLGYLMQQINDMFDLYKDHVHQQQTLFTQTRDLHENYEDYLHHIHQLITQFKALDYPPKNITRCLLQISAITGRGMACMQQLLALQPMEGAFDISAYDRKQLICDMEKPGNLLRSFRHSLWLYRQLSHDA